MTSKVYVTGRFTVDQLNAMSSPHPGCLDGCKLKEHGTGKEHEHEARCPDDCVVHRLYDWWYGNFEDDGRFFGVVLPRDRDWDCRRRLALAGFHVFPSQHSPQPIGREHLDLVAHTEIGEYDPTTTYMMRDVAQALCYHYGHPALHPDS